MLPVPAAEADAALLSPGVQPTREADAAAKAPAPSFFKNSRRDLLCSVLSIIAKKRNLQRKNSEKQAKSKAVVYFGKIYGKNGKRLRGRTRRRAGDKRYFHQF
jgi:hypothetical protein